VVKLTFYGHSCWLVESEQVKLLFDPYLSENPLSAISPDEIEADYILISHGHGDHVGDAVDIAKRTKSKIISNFEIVNWFTTKHGIDGHALNIGGGFNFDFGRVQLTIAHHGSTMPDGSAGGNPVGFLMTIDGKKIYNAADTALTYDMKLLGDRHDLDVAMLPIGDNFTMGPEDALHAVSLLNPRNVFPLHYDTFPNIKQDVEDWARNVESDTDAKCIILNPGEMFEL